MNSKVFFTGEKPDIAQWLQEVKERELAKECGMYLIHNGVVRATSRTQVREGAITRQAGESNKQQKVQSLFFDYYPEKVLDAISETKNMPGVFCVRVWLNRGQLRIGDDMMFVLIGGDIRPNVSAALAFLVGELKERCVTETEKI